MLSPGGGRRGNLGIKELVLNKLLKYILILGLIVVVAGAGLGVYVYQSMNSFLETPANVALGQEERFFYVIVEPGSSFERVAYQLYEQGGISDVDRFKLLGRWKKSTGQIKAGEFEFNTGWKPEQVLDQLVTGRSLLHRVTVPEGLPWWEVGRLLEARGFVNFEDFEACVKDSRLMRRYGIPFATAEGFLFPETYMFNKSLTPTKAHAESAVATMVQTFWRSTSHIWEEAAEKAGLIEGEGVEVTASGQIIAAFVPLYARKYPSEVKRLVSLASLVEKESAVPDERPIVAGVYVNRLRINMPLQCDPTIIYGLGPSFKGAILRSHLRDSTNPYNTYRFYGLPPGPICSPGAQAMNAAWSPDENNFLYFVATGRSDGRHIFSRTLNEHNRAVQAYRKEVDQQRAAGE